MRTLTTTAVISPNHTLTVQVPATLRQVSMRWSSSSGGLRRNSHSPCLSAIGQRMTLVWSIRP